MGILNYSTKIIAGKTVGEIQELLGRKGASTVSIDYNQGKPNAVLFSIQFVKNNLNFRLPCNTVGVLEAMKRDRTIPNQYKNFEQAERTAWRIIKDWVQAQIAIIEAGQASMAEVFMPYAIDTDGRTAFQIFAESKQLLLN